jgi:hypothetical protein
MGVDISTLKPDQPTLKKGVKQIQLSYNGIVDQANDNDVTLELLIDPQAPIGVNDDEGNLIKSVKWTQKFPLSVKALSKTVTFVVTRAVTKPQSCSLRLEAKDARGFRSACNSHIIIFK